MKKAIDKPVLTAWQQDIFQMTNCNAAFTNCDANACYDCIIPEIASLAQYQAGLPDLAATLFL
eukprot:5880370-Ditylum_brightwellii.AAC.1